MSVRRRIVQKKEAEKRKIELKIEAKDFGPISNGNITLKPLTIFLGPNSSGKSYAAMLVHSIFESLSPNFPLDEPWFIRKRFFRDLLDVDVHSLLKDFPELKKQIDELEEGDEVEVPKQFIDKITSNVFREIYEKRLHDEIIRSYACKLEELNRIGKKSFALRINFESYEIFLTYKRHKINIEECPQLNIKLRIRAIETSRPKLEVKNDEKGILINVGGFLDKGEDKKFILFRLMDAILDICTSKIVDDVTMPCYYLPAARSGILQGHKALAASMVRNAPHVGIERLEIPKFSGVVSDFISSILSLPDEKGEFYQLAQEFEKELIKGEIVVSTLEEYVYPEIKYNFQGTEIPLHRASSTVSELAPLFLYLKYVIEKGSVLIIEEPEAHLHPENQRILAKFLVKLIREGVNIVITTHSDYLLEQLSSFIMLSKVLPEKRVEKYKYNKEDFLRSNEIAAYIFKYDKKRGGHKISEVEITEEDGISQEEFLKIDELLYEETIKLRRDLSAET